MFSRKKPHYASFLTVAPADLALTAVLNRLSSSFEELHQHYAQEYAKGVTDPQDYLVGSVYPERIRAGNNKPAFDGEECLRSAVVSLASFSDDVWLRNLQFFSAHLGRGSFAYPGFLVLYDPPAREWEQLTGFLPARLGEPQYSAATLAQRPWLSRRLREGVREVRFIRQGIRRDENERVIGSWWGVEFPRLPGGNKPH